MTESDSALISAIFKCKSEHLKEGADLSVIEDGSLVIIASDFKDRRRCRREFSDRDLYLIYFTEEKIENPICINKTVITAERFGINSLMRAAKQLGIKKKRNPAASEFYWGKTQKMLEIKEIAEKVTRNNISVHISGETGTGKTLLAKYIAGGREMISLNCSYLDSTLAMDALFGHVKGAFTGAESERVGLCRKADGKVLFLDELQDLPYSAQAMLLRVLEDGVMRPLGSDREIKVSFKLITASSLEKSELEKKVRKDLLSRIGVITLTLPPLRERKVDIPELMKKKKAQLMKKYGSYEIKDITPWIDYRWEGNIRELYSKLEYTFTVGRTPDELGSISVQREEKEMNELPSMEEIKEQVEKLWK